MKLFFATNNDSYKSELKDLLHCSLNSALLNTDFEVFLIYDGDKNDLSISENVTVIEHTHRCFNSFLNLEHKNHVQIASGAFLRTEIPYLLNKLGYDDDFCVYSDYDVIFQKKNFNELKTLTPEYFAASTEFDKNDWSYVNTGIMVLNAKNLFKDDEKILNYINLNINDLDTWDQTMYNVLYEGKIDKLPIEYNWKPYWGINNDAKIIHFHGIKPLNYYKNKPKDMVGRYNKNLLSYKYYHKLYMEYLNL